MSETISTNGAIQRPLQKVAVVGGVFALIVGLAPSLMAQEVIYRLDDGTSEGGFGSNVNTSGAFFNRFQVQGSFSEITSIEVNWASFSNQDRWVTAAVWSDPNQNSQPDDSVVIGESALTLSNYSGGWQSFDLPTGIDIGPPGSHFFVGVYYSNGSSSESLYIDSDTSGSNQAFGVQLQPSGDPDVLFGYSTTSNLLIRATGVPEPASMSLAALSALLLLRRKR